MSETVLAVAEHRRGSLRDVSYEVAGAGRSLADDLEGDLHVVVVGGDVDGFAEDLDREGVDVIHTVDEGEEFNHDVAVQAVSALVRELDPAVVVSANSVNGMDFAPALAGRLDRPLVTDCLTLEAGEGLAATREMYGSKVETAVELARPAVVTVRPGVWGPLEGVGDAEVRRFEPAIDEAAVRTTVTGYEEVGGGDVDITDADVLVSVGRGIGDEDNLELAFELAEALGATVSASRPIVDAGWLPKGRQVGQSGRTVSPDVYLALGISGAVQHVAGMKGAGTVIAVNTDPNAPIFDLADYGVVGDLFEVVPALIEAFDGRPRA